MSLYREMAYLNGSTEGAQVRASHSVASRLTKDRWWLFELLLRFAFRWDGWRWECGAARSSGRCPRKAVKPLSGIDQRIDLPL